MDSPLNIYSNQYSVSDVWLFSHNHMYYYHYDYDYEEMSHNEQYMLLARLAASFTVTLSCSGWCHGSCCSLFTPSYVILSSSFKLFFVFTYRGSRPLKAPILCLKQEKLSKLLIRQ